MTAIPATVASARNCDQPETPPAQRLLLHDVRWDAYLAIGKALQDRPVRMTFDRGRLEFMTTSPEHEIYKKWLTRCIEALAEEYNRPFVAAGNMTFQREDLDRALEPDDCFWIAQEPRMRGKLDWNSTSDPPPDLVVEIEVSRSGVDRMAMYAALGVPEVWRFDGTTLQVCLLEHDQTYRTSERSLTFPAIPLGELVRFLRPSETLDNLTALREFRVWVRTHLPDADRE